MCDLKNIGSFIKTLSLFLICHSIVNGQPAETYPTLEYPSLQRLSISLPYIKYYGQDSSLLVFGSNHTLNFEDPQINQIGAIFNSFRPTVVLYEGDGISTAKTSRETVETFFEMGFAKYLADSLGILSVNIEPPSREKFQFLLSSYSSDDILLATLGLQITLLQMNSEPLASVFPNMIADLEKEGLPLGKEQKSFRYFRSLYQKKFGAPFSYDTFDSRSVQAKFTGTVFNEINQTANAFRDQHMIGLTREFIEKGERVFLIVGGWHAIVCEPAFVMITKP